ncbi:MAG: hypothetical protein AABX11_02060 [Nanoarchaeota archaeon]
MKVPMQDPSGRPYELELEENPELTKKLNFLYATIEWLNHFGKIKPEEKFE